MKFTYLVAFASCLILFSCSKSDPSSSVETQAVKKAGDPDFIGYLPFSVFGGSGVVELHGRTVHDEFNGRDQPRRVWCTRPKNNCLEFHRVRDGNKVEILDETQTTELNKLCADQHASDIEDYFNNGNGSTLLSFLKDATPSFWDGLIDGTKTIFHGGYDVDSGLNTYIIADAGLTLHDVDLIDGNFYVFQI